MKLVCHHRFGWAYRGSQPLNPRPRVEEMTAATRRYGRRRKATRSRVVTMIRARGRSVYLDESSVLACQQPQSLFGVERLQAREMR